MDRTTSKCLSQNVSRSATFVRDCVAELAELHHLGNKAGVFLHSFCCQGASPVSSSSGISLAAGSHSLLSRWIIDSAASENISG